MFSLSTLLLWIIQIRRKNQYAYFMEGFDQDWNFVSNQTSATYTNLDPGNMYSGLKEPTRKMSGPNEARLNYHHPSILENPMVYCFDDCFDPSDSGFFNQADYSKSKKKSDRRKKKIELQLKTIKNQIDPHFAFNAMNMVGSLVYKGDPDTVYDYFTVLPA
ncbi:MAG: triple tyrosine motif-containing protein [Bacteroidales bacterium]